MISLSRIRAVFLKELVQMRRDRPTFAIMIMVPIIQLTLFGFAIDTDPRHLPTAVELRDDGPLTRSFLASLRQSDYFRIVAQVRTDGEGEKLLRSGKVAHLIVDGLTKGTETVWAPPVLKYPFFVFRLLPRAVWRKVSERG